MELGEGVTPDVEWYVLKSRKFRIALNGGQDRIDYRDGSGGTVEIFDIIVDSERGKGWGRRLLAELFARLDPETRVYAITRADNEIAQQFYEACGFAVVNPLRRFYGDGTGVDAMMYVRKAGGPL